MRQKKEKIQRGKGTTMRKVGTGNLGKLGGGCRHGAKVATWYEQLNKLGQFA